jgi:hypothetical protein
MQTIDRFVDALFGFDCCFVDGKGFQIEVFLVLPTRTRAMSHQNKQFRHRSALKIYWINYLFGGGNNVVGLEFFKSIRYFYIIHFTFCIFFISAMQ